MNQYELAYIVDASLAEDKREKIVDTVKSILTTNRAEPGELETWGKRDFTFPIAKQTSGVYYLQYFRADPTVVAGVETRLKRESAVMRYLIVKQEKRKAVKSTKKAGKPRIEA